MALPMTNVACPYCGLKQKAKPTEPHDHTDLVRCQFNDAGCDRLMVVKFTVKFSAKGLKIEGQEEV